MLLYINLREDVQVQCLPLSLPMASSTCAGCSTSTMDLYGIMLQLLLYSEISDNGLSLLYRNLANVDRKQWSRTIPYTAPYIYSYHHIYI